MTENVADAPGEDPRTGLPATWSDSARETYMQVEEEAPSLNAAQRAGLFEACSLLALADGLAETIPTNGLMTTGSQGQLVVNPAVAEVRALRRDAIAALRSLGLNAGPKYSTAASMAGAALVSARWGNR